MSIAHVVIDDPEDIPDIFWAIKVERYIDVEAVLINLEAGFPVSGAHLEYSDDD